MHLPTSRRTLYRAAGAATLVAAALLVPVTPAAAAPSPATVIGTVTGPDGEVLAGIPVGLTAFDPDVRYLHTVTDSRGRYRITGIEADAEAGAAVIPPPHYTGGTAPYGYLRGGSARKRLPHGSTTTMDVQLGLGAAMAGRVLDDRSGGPVAGTVVKLFWNNGGDNQYGAVVTTAGDGTWWAHNLDQRGSRVWTAFVDGSGSSADALFGWEATRAPNAPYAIPAGGVTKGVVFRVRPRAKIVASVALPPGSEVGITAGGSGAGGALQFGTGPFTLYPVARYGDAGTTGPLCAYGLWTAASPLGLARQCRDVPFSSTAQLKTSLTMAVGGAVQGTVGDGDFYGSIWVEWNGQRIYGSTDDASRASYTIGSIPTGTYVVHATQSGGLSTQSAPVSVVQGKITKHVDLTLP